MRIISEQELKDILDKHGKWLRNEEGGQRANLSSADLSSVDLSYADLSSVDLSYADLRFANLRFANLSSADLSSVDLSYADLRFANLSSADLSSVDLSYADLSSVDLSYADLVLFQFLRHQAFFTLDGTLRIGCQVMPITEWVLGFEEIGKQEGYSSTQIKAYGNFIKMCMEMFEESTNK